MGLSLWGLIEASILVLNAICILHEERFLAKIGWSTKHAHIHQGFDDNPSIKTNIINLIKSIRTVMRIPLIFVNTILILKKLVFG